MIPVNVYTGRNGSRIRQFPISSLLNEMSHLFDDVGPALRARSSNTKFSPDIDLVEGEKEYVLQGEFPGMEVSDISIELKDNSIILSGEKRSEREQKEGERFHYERTFGSFRRVIPFDVEVDEEGATAEMKNGVLEIHVPKSPKVLRGAKKLTIKTS